MTDHVASVLRGARAKRRRSKESNLRRLRERGESLASFALREATPTDIPELARVHVTAWNATHGGWVWRRPSRELRGRQWTTKFSSLAPDWFCYLVQDGVGTVVGFATGQPYTEPYPPGFSGRLEKIYLQDEYQRLGRGRRLVGRVAGRLLARGVDSMLLFSQPDNPSCVFFEVLGGERLRSPTGEFHGASGWRDLRRLVAACPDAPAAPTARRGDSTQ
jgi:GNAT superfamily N-acetyltransferase